jgi:hypothetical protein
MQFTCLVNSVGPTSGDFEGNFLDPRDDPDTHGPVVILTLTDVNNAFTSYSFLVATIENGWQIHNAVLAVALAAVNTGFQVLADVDWPAETVESEGTVYTLPVYCHSLWINAG